MKNTRFFLLAVVALLCVGLVSFEKDDNSNGGSNSSYNSGGSVQHSSSAYVDMGLPSGLLWATRNVGASSPEDYGYYFAWGETQPKSVYSWSTYTYCSGSDSTLTKYCNKSTYGYNGFTDNLTTLQPGDDAATANWGSGWRTPTEEEWKELVNNTTSIWTTRKGVRGQLFTASNGNSIFLPAAGFRSGSKRNLAGESCYNSASLLTDYPSRARVFILLDETWYRQGGAVCFPNPRCDGSPVRAVRSAH